MLRCQNHKRCSVKRIRPRRENPDRFVLPFHLEIHLSTITFADPVRLHRQHLLWPPLGQSLTPFQQSVGIICNFKEPPFLKPLRYLPVATPATLVDHLFVSQNRLARFTPVDLGVLPVYQSFFKKLEKTPLVPAIVFRSAGRNLAVPVIAKSQAFQLSLHRGDILFRPLGRVRVVLYRCIFRRQAEGIPPDRMQHVKTTHTHESCNSITYRVVPHMAHVDSA